MICKFRKYDSIGDSLLDHGKLLTLSRYKSVIASKDYKEAALNVYKSGYCTDAEYPNKLISIIEQNKLYIYDAAPIGSSSSNNDSENIKYFQSCLTKMKIKDINNNNLVVDGSNGPLTASAVKKFQDIVGITSDGICGPNTINAIEIIMKRPSCSINNPGNKIVVRYLQYRIQSNIDGAFGPDTERCIKTYQKNNELVADGIVGNCSWERLLA